ncbi:MAG: insulinase family protein [Bacteroides sp.]|nr:insulinase family protein [Roseburia sp.]MCM1345651.1 insulinase family protein [Bacteroides sp.]MCM1421918.1 insulinase family protein [Bacteroides sp.]
MNRNIQPEIKPLEQLTVCNPEVITMANGIELKYIKTYQTDIIRLDFMFKGGQWIQEIPLQAFYAFKQLKEGTQSFKGEDIAERLDFYGATLETSSNMSYSTISLCCLKKHLEHVVPILQSILQEPTYAQDKLSIALTQGKAAYAASLQSVGTQCRQLFSKNLYGKGHPMAQYPSLQNYDILTPEDLLRFRNMNICSDNCKMFLTGTYDENITRIVAETFGQNKWGGNGGKFIGYASFAIPQPEHNRFSYRMNNKTVQAAIRVGRVFPDRRHKDFTTLNVMSTILGGYFGSRLMSNIRETKGYTYDISSVIYQLPHNTTFIISTETPDEYTECVIEEIHKEMLRLSNEPVSSEELANVKNYLSGHICRNCETGLNTSSMLMRLDVTNRTTNDVIEDFERMKRITPEDIMKCASSYLHRKSMIECVAGYSENSR